MDMLTYSEVILLRDKLASGEIDLSSAQAAYWKDYKEGQNSWHTEDWKERRSKVIKDKCEICNSTDTLTLQHLSHPQKYAEYSKDTVKAYLEAHRNTHPTIDKDVFTAYVLEKYEYVPVAFCPNCSWSNPSVRVRKTPKYRCPGCKHEFDHPVYHSVDELIAIFYADADSMEVREKCFVSKEWRNKNNLSNIRYWLLRDQVKNTDTDTIGKQAFLLYLDDTIKYLSFEDTITACRKCAYNNDIKGRELCPICKTNYKGIEYPTCISCLPEDKLKAALASIEFGKEWQSMHGDLGIG